MESDLSSLRGEFGREHGSRVQADQAAAVLSAQKFDLELRLTEWKEQVHRAAEQIVKVQERADRLATSLELERD